MGLVYDSPDWGNPPLHRAVFVASQGNVVNRSRVPQHWGCDAPASWVFFHFGPYGEPCQVYTLCYCTKQSESPFVLLISGDNEAAMSQRHVPG